MRRMSKVLGVVLGGAALAVPGVGWACGGFFCSQSMPVNQAAERIIFAQDGDRVDAVIEVQYEGPSRSFAWVLPVPGGEAVEVGVSSRQILDTLQALSNPVYNLNTRPADGCGSRWLIADASAILADEQATSAGPGATVVVSDTVGPYDYVQLSVEDSEANPAQVALDWLGENGFDVSGLGEDLLGEYLDAGLDLIAFRLSKGNDSGSIRPVRLSWRADNPVVPIRATAVAANDDMGVLVWVLGSARAIPSNYFHLELNEAYINWFNAGPTYNDVVSRAADEAGGQGFVTEQVEETEIFRGRLLGNDVLPAFEEFFAAPPTEPQRVLQAAIDLGTSFDSILNTLSPFDGLMELLGDPEVVPLREGTTAAGLFDCVSCYFTDELYDARTDPITGMDVEAFVARLESDVFGPLRETVELFERHEISTRFYTTLSADEMTVDPVFDFNPDLPLVSNVHRATAQAQCDGSRDVVLESGAVVVTRSSSTWAKLPEDLPLNLRVMQLSTSGEGEVVLDNTEEVREALPRPSRSSNSDGDSGCNIGSSSAPTTLWASLGFLGVFALRRVRRGRARSSV